MSDMLMFIGFQSYKNTTLWLTEALKEDKTRVGCCKASDVNFRDWMVSVLSHIHDYDTDYSKDLAELLPHKWKQRNS